MSSNPNDRCESGQQQYGKAAADSSLSVQQCPIRGHAPATLSLEPQRLPSRRPPARSGHTSTSPPTAATHLLPTTLAALNIVLLDRRTIPPPSATPPYTCDCTAASHPPPPLFAPPPKSTLSCQARRNVLSHILLVSLIIRKSLVRTVRIISIVSALEPRRILCCTPCSR